MALEDQEEPRRLQPKGGGPEPHANPSGPPRLSSTMSSRSLQALDFIKRYFSRWGHSPTLGELGAELGVSTKRAYDIVHALSDKRMLEIEAGKARGIRLIDRGAELSEADILLRLHDLGYTIAHGCKVIQAPGAEFGAAVGSVVSQGLTDKGLHALPVLDHNNRETTGVGISGKTDRRAGARDSGAEPRGMGASAP